MGLPGAASVGISVSYGFKYGNWTFTANASLAGAYAYVGYDTRAGFIGGVGAGLSPIMFGNFGIGSSLTSVGFNYSQNGGFSASVFGFNFSYTSGSLSFDPSISASYTININSQLNRHTQATSANSPGLSDQMKRLEEITKELLANMIKPVELGVVKNELLKMPIRREISNVYSILANRIVESTESTVSSFVATAPSGETLSGYFLEPGGPSTILSGTDRRLPAGTYDMEWTYSNHFKQYMYLITNSQVPATRGVRMHIGNFHYDTEACLLPGGSYGIKDENYFVSGSTAKYQNVIKLLNYNRVRLTIRDINP